MIITWYGHSCFKAEDGGISAVFDPYRPGSVPGLRLPRLRADVCVCSHGHDDHFFPEGVELNGGEAAADIERFPSFHDDCGGAKRGANELSLLTLGGVRLLHMGDIGHPLSRETLARIGRVDVLMVPVGGFFTVDAAGARQIKDELSPFVTIPMHYRGPGFGYPQLDEVEKFAALCGDAEYFGSNTLDYSRIEHPCKAILKCPVNK